MSPTRVGRVVRSAALVAAIVLTLWAQRVQGQRLSDDHNTPLAQRLISLQPATPATTAALFALPAPTGRHAVGTTRWWGKDDARPEPFGLDARREVEVFFDQELRGTPSPLLAKAWTMPELTVSRFESSPR